MNIQIFGSSKSFDSKKAERWFKERRLKYQYIDIVKYGMSLGELKSVKSAVGMEQLLNTEKEDCSIVTYLAGDDARLEKVFENQYLIRLPVVRNGKQATVGYHPEIWENWK